MKKFYVLFLMALFCVSFPLTARSQNQDISFASGISIKLGGHFEYFSRKITWDDGEFTSDLRAYIFALNTEIVIDDGFAVSALIGYTLPSYDSLTFRQLPFSVELDDGNMGGFILGAEIKKTLFFTPDFDIGLAGQFVYQIGQEKKWDIPGLNVTGTLTGKSTWMRAVVGPYIQYTAFESFSPYLAVCYNNLWGEFKMDQSIQTLEGSEEKKIESKNLIDITLGSIITFGEKFFLRGEAHVLPSSGGMDFGVVAVASFLF